MEKFKLNINGKEVKGLPGQTILEVAREMTFSFRLSASMKEPRYTDPAALCMCEVEGNPKLWKACATVIARAW